MFIHRGESFGAGVPQTKKRYPRVPDIIIREDEAAYEPVPCIHVTQVVDELDYDVLGAEHNKDDPNLPTPNLSRRPSDTPSITSQGGGKLRTRANSRRVSLITGEALEQAHAALALAQLPGDNASPLPSAIVAAATLHAQESQLSMNDGGSRRPSVSLYHPPPPNYENQEYQKDYDKDYFDKPDDRRARRKSTINKDDLGHLDGSVTSPQRMKSNQRWLKLRTTVQLSGALSSSMNRVKPPLKREDSFIARFSTRQIAELQDTVDQTDFEDCSKNSTGSPNIARPKWKRRHHSTVINPYGNAYFYWLSILSMCVLYNLWTAIVRQSFPQLQDRNFVLWCVLDILTDCVLVLDIIVQYRTGYLEQGLIVYDSQKLAAHYRNSKCFFLDMLAVFPIDYFVMGMFPAMRFYYPMFRCPRFLKVYRVYNYYYMVESRTLYPNLWRVVNLVHILLLLAHCFGCFYFMLSKAENFQGDWVYPMHARPEFQELSRQYLGSVYWSTLTLTTIGDLPNPETNRQYIFTIVSYLIGVFVFATIVGQVGNVITNRNANRLEFERLLDGAKLYMRHHKVPREMQRRVQRWYDYSWSRGRIQGGGDINSALGLLPDKLRTELALHVNLATLKKVSIFKECQPEFLHDLVLKMKAYIFTPGDLICRKGEVAREMFIIADGILEVISETGKVLTTMKAGDFFGEIGILNLDGLNKRTADVRSVGYSELFSLSREDVLTAMKDYPEAQEILQSLGRKRLMDARHNSKSVSSSSSKRDSPSPTRDSGQEDKPKKIVSRIRSDVSAIKNAFRKSRGMTRETETVELEPLTNDGRSNAEIDVPDVKRLLRRLGREDGSCSSDSAGTTRGVLKRMAKVTSDDTQGSMSGNKLSVDEPHGLLGAGLPIINKLKLMKDKEDRDRNKKDDNDESQEVIGAGLPMFARLRLLKIKEEKERLERLEREKIELNVEETADTSGFDNKVDVNILTGKTTENGKTGLTTKGIFRKAVIEKNKNGDIIVSNACDTDNINDLNKDTEAVSSSISNGTKNNNSKEIFTKPISPQSGKLLNTSSIQSETKCDSPLQSDDSDSSGQLQRRDSFKRAMGEGLISSKKDSDNPETDKSFTGSRTSSLSSSISASKITDHKDSRTQVKDIKDSDDPTYTFNNLPRNQYDLCNRTLSADFLRVPSDDISPPLSSPESSDTPERKSLKSILKKMSREDSRGQLLPGTELRKLMRAPTIEGFVARRSKFNKSVSFQRRTLNSPPYQTSLDSLVRRRVSSDGGIRPSYGNKNDPYGTDGVNDLLIQLSGIKSQANEKANVETLVHGVRRILQSKMEDVEAAFEAKMAAMEEEIATRDKTIGKLHSVISRLKSSNGSEDFISTVDQEQVVGNSSPLTNKSTVRMNEHYRSVSLDASNSGSDEDEPLFMRCTSIESIIHHSPDSSLGNKGESSSPQPHTWPQQRHMEDEQPPVHQRDYPVPQQKKIHSIIDIGSSTDDDLFSFSSDDDRYLNDASVFKNIGNGELEESFDEEYSSGEENEVPDDPQKEFDSEKLSSQDWEVQMLAQKLVKEQRVVARRVDKDIATGIFRSDLAEVHTALATDNIADLTDIDVVRLENLVKKERDTLQHFSRIYSLDERPVLKEEFCTIYRTRSQQLLSRSSEYKKSGVAIQKRISKLLSQLVSLPLTEQFLIDRLLYSQEKSKRLAKQMSLCDDQLSSYGARRLAGLRKQGSSGEPLSFRRSQSVCSPPSSASTSPRRLSLARYQQSPVQETSPEAKKSGLPSVSAMLSSLQRSMTFNHSRNSSQGSVRLDRQFTQSNSSR